MKILFKSNTHDELMFQKLTNFENETLSLNAILMAIGGLGFILGLITCILSAILAGCYQDRRVGFLVHFQLGVF